MASTTTSKKKHTHETRSAVLVGRLWALGLKATVARPLVEKRRRTGSAAAAERVGDARALELLVLALGDGNRGRHGW